MVIILPDAGDGLDAVEARLDPETLRRWIDALRARPVEVALPRFTIDPPSSTSLSTQLSALGMARAFSAQAEFSAMAEAERLMIAEVFHKAFVEVNEEGTEAAAATAVVMGPGGPPPPPQQPARLIADHPFLFAIRDLRMGTLLFLGRLSDPRG
jgi:serpin B